MNQILPTILLAVMLLSIDTAPATAQSVVVSHSQLEGIGEEPGVMRRDPSDVIKVGDLYYVWYSKGKISPGYDATVWYATSTDGRTWTEKSEAIAKGEPGTWEGASVFTPNILVAEGRYWLFYTGTSMDYHKKPFRPDSKIGIAVSDSPDGPWERLATNPALSNSDNKDDFDSHLVDDACLVTREGKYYFYYKGRQEGKSPKHTQMGLAIADRPEGPYVRHKSNPVIPGNHEVLVWTQGSGVAAMIGTTGPKTITNSIMYAADGINFSKTGAVKKGPWAGGAYRPEAFTQSGKGTIPEWGVEIGRSKGKKKEGKLPFIQRFDVTELPGSPAPSMISPSALSPSTVGASAALSQADAPASQTFADDLAFMKKHTDIVVLQNGNAAVAVAPAYQGRVMTSTFDLKTGPSFGWINRPVIKKGLLSDEQKKGTLEEHIYIFGGEERFWLGPEGGQYALFFKPGAKFTFDDWATPAAIDTDPFTLTNQTESSAVFSHNTELVNHSGVSFKVGIERTVSLVDKQQAAAQLGIELADELRLVGYETDNKITNQGAEAWKPETGLMSIWILGMYNPSPKTTVVIPFQQGDEAALGPKVNDAYFGKVPAEYLKVEEDKLFFRGDGTRRGKIGITARRSKGIAGSYDATGRVLNIVTYNVQDAPNGFVNSMWELQKEPYSGDVINSYNDGSPEEGKPPLGPFYEVETSSPAAALKPGETLQHVQRTFHIHGSEEQLTVLAKKLLGVSLDSIKAAFKGTRKVDLDGNAPSDQGSPKKNSMSPGKDHDAKNKETSLFPGNKVDFHGFDRYTFETSGVKVSVVCPKKAAPGKPWLWRSMFWGRTKGATAQVTLMDLKLVEQGYHVVVRPGDVSGHPRGNAAIDAAYKYLTQEHGFSTKVAMGSMSRETLALFQWASQNPEKVQSIYVDNGVCNVKSWPGGKQVEGTGSMADGAPKSWKLLKTTYSFKSDEEAIAAKVSPIDWLEPLAKAGVPILLCSGTKDTTVPYEENAAVLKERYESLGGSVKVILEEKAHHPHGLKDTTPVAEFIKLHTPQNN